MIESFDVRLLMGTQAGLGYGLTVFGSGFIGRSALPSVLSSG
jgi:hypothetical protein